MKTIRSMKGFLFYLTGVVFVSAAVLLLAGCMDPLGRESTAAAGISVMNAPSTVTELELTVSGPGMSTIQRTLTPSTSSVTLEVPVGVNRRFYIGGDVYSGERRLPVSAAGASVNLTMYPGPVFPGRFAGIFTNGRGMIQMRDGVNPFALGTGPDFLFPSVLDLDYSSDGRVFALLDSGVFLFSSLRDIDPPRIFASNNLGRIGVDRVNSWIYAVDSSGSLFRFRFDGTGPETLSVPARYELSNDFDAAVAVGSDGFVYLTPADLDLEGAAALIRYNPSTQTVVASYASPFPEEFAFDDVAVFGNDVYVLSRSAPSGFVVRRFDTNLTLLENFGSDGESPEGVGEFSDPSRFAATIVKRLIVIDQGGALNGDGTRIVSFDNMMGSGWSTIEASELDYGPEMERTFTFNYIS